MSESQAGCSCAQPVEWEVSGDYQWTEARQSEMFRSVERTGNGNITLSEDQLHVLDKFGTWIQVEYSCHYETRTGELKRVEVWPIEPYAEVILR